MPKRKDAPSSVLTRLGRKTLTGIQASTTPLNTRKSPRFQIQMAPTPSTVKKKPVKNEKQMGSTPLRRSERGKNPVDVPASYVKSTEKSMDISEENAEGGSRDPDGGSKKRKRYHAVEFKTRKSPRFQNQMGPTPSTVKKEAETSEKQMGSIPLRRSERGKNPEEPRMSPAVPLNPQEKKRENHGSSNEEVLQSGGQILDEDIARKERNEIDKFDTEWDEKKMTIVNDFRLEKTLIRYLYGSNSSVRSEKLNLAEKEFANNLNAHEISRQAHFNDLKATLKAAVGQQQMVVNDGISLNGSAHATQIVDLMESGKKDQETREVAPGLVGNPIEEESHDKPIGDISAKQHTDIDTAPNDYSAEVSHAVEDQNKNGSNDISLEYADGSHDVEDPKGTGPNHVVPNAESVELGFQLETATKRRHKTRPPQFSKLLLKFQIIQCQQFRWVICREINNDSHLLQQPSENGIQDQEGQADPTPMVDQIIPKDSSLNPHDDPSSIMSANPTITENQAAMLTTSEVLAQTTAAQTQVRNALLLEQYMLDLQRNANSNLVGSQMPRCVDPLHVELEQLSSVKEKMVKSYHDNIQKINIEYEKEIAEAIAEIRLKYRNKRQEVDATFNSQKKEVENNMNTAVINQVLAATFRQKCQDVSPGCVAALQQACQAESMQQLHRFHGPSTCLLGQFPGTQQTPQIPATAGATPPQQTQPPGQIVHRPSALFLTLLSRHPHTTNLRPANTTPIRPPPNTQACSQSPQTQPLVSSVTRSPAPHMQVLVSRVIRTPGPHMRPLASSGVRSSTSPMRPSNRVSSSRPPGFGTYHRILPVQHVTSSVLLTSPSISQPLNSTSSVQPLPPLPCKRFLVPQPRSESPHASVATSAHSSLPCGPSVPQSKGPQNKLNDNVKTLTYTAARALSILKIPEFPGWGNGALPPSAHELVYLSDDD